MTSEVSPNWIVVQLGARENYSVARALHRKGALGALITDMWGPNNPLLSALTTRLKERVHPELRNANVLASSAGAIAHELTGTVCKRAGWDRIIRRNDWFQNAVIKRMKALDLDKRSIVFAYSYAAERVLEFAKSKGATTVLGQIDPALAESNLIAKIYNRAGETFDSPPTDYWSAWRRETELADIILVNSEWSKQGICQEGVAADKIRVVPLAAEFDALVAKTEVPTEFSDARPLRMLFLGQVNLRKGIDLLLNSMQLLSQAPIQLDIVGPIQVGIADVTKRDSRIRFHGAVPRSRVSEFYRNSDIFVFPTRSDGFGLTQLEALANGKPIISSKFCGEVVTHGENGLILSELDVNSLANVIKRVCNDTNLLKELTSRATLTSEYSLESLGCALDALANQNTGTD